MFYLQTEGILEKRILNWLEKGIITQEQASLLIKEAEVENTGIKQLAINIALYTTGAILIGIGVISFICANDWLIKLFESRFTKIAATTLLTISCLFCGYFLAYQKTKLVRLGKVLIFLSCLLFGGVLALIGQIYNFEADNYSIYLIWLVCILPLAYIFKSAAINILSIVLLILTTLFLKPLYHLDNMLALVFSVFLYTAANIPFVKNYYNNFSKQYKITGLYPIFFTFLLMTSTNHHTYNNNKTGIVIFALLIAANILMYIFEKNKNKQYILETSFIILSCLYSIVLMQFGTGQIYNIIILNAALIFIIWALYYFGYQNKDIKTVNSATFFLSIFIAYNYFRFGYDYMDKALFFTTGGIILLSLGILVERKKNKLLKEDVNENKE